MLVDDAPESLKLRPTIWQLWLYFQPSLRKKLASGQLSRAGKRVSVAQAWLASLVPAESKRFIRW